MDGTSEATSRVGHDYRSVSAHPRPEDILPETEVHLSKNITLGKYKHVSHYLATHFDLLREDFMAPLRRSLSAYKEALKNGEVAKVSEFRVYLNARFVNWESYYTENFTKTELDEMNVGYIGNSVNRKMFKLLAPGKCQQKTAGDKEVLIFGTLVCFSCDYFETVFFGVVTTLINVKKGFINVELLESIPFIYTKPYIMLECKNYFHTNKVVLLALQNLDPLKLPMQRYIVETNQKMLAPSYLSHSLKFTLANVTFKVADLAAWPSKDKLNLNATQYQAFRNALTSEFAIIQGPPGTGKTYVTVKIAEAFIKNYEALTTATANAGPILVIAFTNHALDQFLEALIPFTNNIVRIGQRSANANVQRFVYSGCKRDGKILAGYYKQLENILEQINYLEMEMEFLLNPFHKIFDIGTFDTNTYPNFIFWLRQVNYAEFVFWLVGELVTKDERMRRWDMTRLVTNPAKVYVKGILKDVDPTRHIQWIWLHYEEYTRLFGTTKVTKTYWLNNYTIHIKSRLKFYKDRLSDQWDQLQKYKQWQDAQTIAKAVVVGMTTTVAAQKQHLLASLHCPIIIVEEAAEVLESHIVVSMTQHCQHLILVGDHQQLRPKTYDYQIGQKYCLGISLFERMVLNKMPCTTLDTQHRMQPEISRLIVPAIYPNLKDHSSVRNLPDVIGVHHNVFFIHHTHAESAIGTSQKNLHEVKYVVALASHLVKQGHKQSDITIIATYKAQVDAIQALCANFGLKTIRVSTVDNFQGEENQIILLSLVRNNRSGNIGFLAEENRVCVALSRARKGFYMIGNIDILCRASRLWLKIRNVLVANNQLGTGLKIYCLKHPKNVRFAVEPEDFQCSQNCEKKLPDLRCHECMSLMMNASSHSKTILGLSLVVILFLGFGSIFSWLYFGAIFLYSYYRPFTAFFRYR